MKKIILPILALMILPMLQAALAYTLEQEIANADLARKAVQIASENPKTGSGTPYFAADGVLGASAIAASIFGGIATMFFVRGRRGRYVAQGRG